jgi:hypothetical protein
MTAPAATPLSAKRSDAKVKTFLAVAASCRH